MKQFINTICIITILAGLVFSANSRVLKSEFKKDRMKRVEPDYRRGPGASRDDCPQGFPQDDNGNPSHVCAQVGEVIDCEKNAAYMGNSEVTIIDSSSNGFGMVATVTRPMDMNRYSDDKNMVVVYRQYAGENTTHGQLGAGYSNVNQAGELEWDVQYNVNANGSPPWGGGGVGYSDDSPTAQARYPSGIAGREFPYAIWNEYTAGPPAPQWDAGCASDYGGRPYFSYDEFEWGGGSWLQPTNLDPLWDCSKDLWQGSVAYGYDNATGEDHVSMVYDDWTRTGSYLFTSEVVEDGYIVLSTETLIVNPQHLGTDGYSSSAILSMNGNGQGILGIDGIFAGNDMDAGTCGPPASNLTCNKTPMFKITNNFGQTWAGNHGAFDFYFVPDEVFDDIFDNWPGTDVDACTGEVSTIDDFWSWYEFDMRVDNYGNPHIVISLIGESASYFHFLDGYTGFYHMTIDRNNLENPGPINSETGWNWSYIPLPANNSFEWNRPDGYSYLYGAMCQMSISMENDDIIYMVANIATEGDMDPELDTDGDGVFPTPGNATECALNDGLTNPYEQFPNWSEDIYVAKSSDNGSTWTALENLTKTPKTDDGLDFAGSCSPEEQYVHSAHWADDERVYFQYNQPNWGFNEIGDPLGADHMNRVFLGYSWVEETGVGGCTDLNNCSFDEGAGFHDEGECGQGDYLCGDGTTGCGCAGECADGLEPPTVEDCDGNCDGGAVLVCNPVADGGGEICAPAGTVVCTESMADNCDENPDDENCEPFNGLCNEETEINDWYDCSDVHCGMDDPLFYETGCGDAGYVACDGGRCYTCDGFPDAITEGDCLLATGSSSFWDVETEVDTNDVDEDGDTTEQCDDSEPGCNDVVTDEASCEGLWITFANQAFVNDLDYPSNETGNPDDCYCTTSGAESSCSADCLLGDLNEDGGWNVMDIVQLANCILSQNCEAAQDGGCAGDLNGDGGWNVMDIVQLANCILSSNCGGRLDDASYSKLILEDNIVSIEADGFIGGVQMTLTHGDDFRVEMTEHALLADYLTTGNETRLLIITPETDKLFSYSGDFEITELIVANSHSEVSASLPLANSFSLSQAYPNPFNPVTTMELVMGVDGDMQVSVYNLTGQLVTTLASGYHQADTYNLIWDATDAASGMYFVKAQADGNTKIQKLMLIK